MLSETSVATPEVCFHVRNDNTVSMCPKPNGCLKSCWVLSDGTADPQMTSQRCLQGGKLGRLPFTLLFETSPRVIISVKKASNVTITVDRGMSFMVLLHRVWKKHPVNVDFLGIYIPPSNNFSANAHGLIGKAL